MVHLIEDLLTVTGSDRGFYEISQLLKLSLGIRGSLVQIFPVLFRVQRIIFVTDIIMQAGTGREFNPPILYFLVVIPDQLRIGPRLI